MHIDKSSVIVQEWSDIIIIYWIDAIYHTTGGVQRHGDHKMASAMPSLTSIWHTLRDTGKTCHCLQGRLLHSQEIRCLAIHARTHGRSIRGQPPVTAQRQAVQDSIQGKADKHSFYASDETTFASLGLQKSVVDALQSTGYGRLSKVQVCLASKHTTWQAAPPVKGDSDYLSY